VVPFTRRKEAKRRAINHYIGFRRKLRRTGGKLKALRRIRFALCFPRIWIVEGVSYELNRFELYVRWEPDTTRQELTPTNQDATIQCAGARLNIIFSLPSDHCSEQPLRLSKCQQPPTHFTFDTSKRALLLLYLCKRADDLVALVIKVDMAMNF
jgi:hypothetical protein